MFETWPRSSTHKGQSQEASVTCSISQSVSSVQSLSHVQLFATPWTAACQASLSIITNSQGLLKLMSIKLVMPSNHLIFFSCLQSFPASGSFPMSLFFASGGQSFSFSISPSSAYNIQDWFPLGWTGWISLQSKGLWRVLSTPQFKSINSLALSFLYGSNCHIHTGLLEKP